MGDKATSADEFAVLDKDSNSVKSLKQTGANLAAHIAKRTEHVKTVSGEEAMGHQETLAYEREQLAGIKKAIGAQSK